MKEFIKTPEFKSEIDWSKWNPDTPKHPELISEYNEIEKKAKENGTWMNQPRDYSIFSEVDEINLKSLKDKLQKGEIPPQYTESVQRIIPQLENQKIQSTVFQGSPEQFVQQQSSWFKRAFPEGFRRTFRGANSNSTFRGNLAKSDNLRIGSIFTGNKSSAVPKYGSFERIIRPEEFGLNHEGIPGHMELIYKPTNNSINFSAKSSDWNNINRSLLPVEHINMKAITKIARDNPSIVTTDDISRYIQDNDIDYASIKNIIDGTLFKEEIIYNHKPNNYLKSAWYNVGFFDMNDPNIYK